jgi:predicted fused transcriptional regulator/phosphomethylpyrimidine kinase
MAKVKQDQGSLTDQLAKLVVIANQAGLYDASDYIANVVQEARSKDPEYQANNVINTTWELLKKAEARGVVSVSGRDILLDLRNKGVNLTEWDIHDILSKDASFYYCTVNSVKQYERRT